MPGEQLVQSFGAVAIAIASLRQAQALQEQAQQQQAFLNMQQNQHSLLISDPVHADRGGPEGGEANN